MSNSFDKLLFLLENVKVLDQSLSYVLHIHFKSLPQPCELDISINHV